MRKTQTSFSSNSKDPENIYMTDIVHILQDQKSKIDSLLRQTKQGLQKNNSKNKGFWNSSNITAEPFSIPSKILNDIQGYENTAGRINNILHKKVNQLKRITMKKKTYEEIEKREREKEMFEKYAAPQVRMNMRNSVGSGSVEQKLPPKSSKKYETTANTRAGSVQFDQHEQDCSTTDGWARRIKLAKEKQQYEEDQDQMQLRMIENQGKQPGILKKRMNDSTRASLDEITKIYSPRSTQQTTNQKLRKEDGFHGHSMILDSHHNGNVNRSMDLGSHTMDLGMLNVHSARNRAASQVFEQVLAKDQFIDKENNQQYLLKQVQQQNSKLTHKQNEILYRQLLEQTSRSGQEDGFSSSSHALTPNNANTNGAQRNQPYIGGSSQGMQINQNNSGHGQSNNQEKPLSQSAGNGFLPSLNIPKRNSSRNNQYGSSNNNNNRSTEGSYYEERLNGQRQSRQLPLNGAGREDEDSSYQNQEINTTQKKYGSYPVVYGYGNTTTPDSRYRHQKQQNLQDLGVDVVGLEHENQQNSKKNSSDNSLNIQNRFTGETAAVDKNNRELHDYHNHNYHSNINSSSNNNNYQSHYHESQGNNDNNDQDGEDDNISAQIQKFKQIQRNQMNSINNINPNHINNNITYHQNNNKRSQSVKQSSKQHHSQLNNSLNGDNFLSNKYGEGENRKDNVENNEERLKLLSKYKQTHLIESNNLKLPNENEIFPLNIINDKKSTNQNFFKKEDQSTSFNFQTTPYQSKQIQDGTSKEEYNQMIPGYLHSMGSKERAQRYSYDLNQTSANQKNQKDNFSKEAKHEINELNNTCGLSGKQGYKPKQQQSIDLREQPQFDRFEIQNQKSVQYQQNYSKNATKNGIEAQNSNHINEYEPSRNEYTSQEVQQKGSEVKRADLMNLRTPNGEMDSNHAAPQKGNSNINKIEGHHQSKYSESEQIKKAHQELPDQSYQIKAQKDPHKLHMMKEEQQPLAQSKQSQQFPHHNNMFPPSQTSPQREQITASQYPYADKPNKKAEKKSGLLEEKVEERRDSMPSQINFSVKKEDLKLDLSKLAPSSTSNQKKNANLTQYQSEMKPQKNASSSQKDQHASILQSQSKQAAAATNEQINEELNRKLQQNFLQRLGLSGSFPLKQDKDDQSKNRNQLSSNNKNGSGAPPPLLLPPSHLQSAGTNPNSSRNKQKAKDHHENGIKLRKDSHNNDDLEMASSSRNTIQFKDPNLFNYHHLVGCAKMDEKGGSNSTRKGKHYQHYHSSEREKQEKKYFEILNEKLNYQIEINLLFLEQSLLKSKSQSKKQLLEKLKQFREEIVQASESQEQSIQNLKNTYKHLHTFNLPDSLFTF